jgi:hypothetical protein
MVKDVYDKSKILTDDQKAMAVYHRDAPGYPGGGHIVAILSQVISKAGLHSISQLWLTLRLAWPSMMQR